MSDDIIEYDSFDDIVSDIEASWFRKKVATNIDEYFRKRIYKENPDFGSSSYEMISIPDTFAIIDVFFIFIPQNSGYTGNPIDYDNILVPCKLIGEISVNSFINKYYDDLILYVKKDSDGNIIINFNPESYTNCEVRMVLSDSSGEYPQFVMNGNAFSDSDFRQTVLERGDFMLCTNTNVNQSGFYNNDFKMYDYIEMGASNEEKKFLMKFETVFPRSGLNIVYSFEYFKGCLQLYNDNSKYIYIDVKEIGKETDENENVKYYALIDIGSYTSKIFNRCKINFKRTYQSSSNYTFTLYKSYINGFANDITLSYPSGSLGGLSILCYFIKLNEIKNFSPIDPRKIIYCENDEDNMYYIDRLVEGNTIPEYNTYSNIPNNPSISTNPKDFPFIYYIDNVACKFSSTFKTQYYENTAYESEEPNIQLRNIDYSELKYDNTNNRYNAITDYDDGITNATTYECLRVIDNKLYSYVKYTNPFLWLFNLEINGQYKYNLKNEYFVVSNYRYQQIFDNVTCTLRKFDHYVGSCSSNPMTIEVDPDNPDVPIISNGRMSTPNRRYRLKQVNMDYVRKEDAKYFSNVDSVDQRQFGDGNDNLILIEIEMTNIDAINETSAYFDENATTDKTFFMDLLIDLAEQKITFIYNSTGENKTKKVLFYPIEIETNKIAFANNNDVITLYITDIAEGYLSYDRDALDVIPPNIKYKVDTVTGVPEGTKYIKYTVKSLYEEVPHSSIMVYTNDNYNKNVTITEDMIINLAKSVTKDTTGENTKTLPDFIDNKKGIDAYNHIFVSYDVIGSEGTKTFTVEYIVNYDDWDEDLIRIEIDKINLYKYVNGKFDLITSTIVNVSEINDINLHFYYTENTDDDDNIIGITETFNLDMGYIFSIDYENESENENEYSYEYECDYTNTWYNYTKDANETVLHTIVLSRD